MAEMPKKADKILIMGLGPLREAPRKNGEAISEFIKFLLSESLPVPDKCRIEVFTMDVQEKVPGTILKREPGMFFRKSPTEDTAQFLSGTTLEVTPEYVITENDLSVNFIDLS